MRNLEISVKHFNVKSVCNNLQQTLYNTLLDSNDLFDKFAKTYYSVGFVIQRQIAKTLKKLEFYIR